MATTTLPLAAEQDQFQHITVINRYLEPLIVGVQGLDSINGIVSGSVKLWSLSSQTFQSDGGTNWHIVSSGKAPTDVYPFNATGLPLLVPLQPTWLELPGTEFQIPFEGVWMHTGTITFDVVGVPGNQYWDVDMELYDKTNDVVLGHLDFSGEGNPTFPVRGTWAYATTGFQAAANNVLRVQRTSTTGDVNVTVCEQAVTGPL